MVLTTALPCAVQHFSYESPEILQYPLRPSENRNRAAPKWTFCKSTEADYTEINEIWPLLLLHSCNQLDQQSCKICLHKSEWGLKQIRFLKIIPFSREWVPHSVVGRCISILPKSYLTPIWTCAAAVVIIHYYIKFMK